MNFLQAFLDFLFPPPTLCPFCQGKEARLKVCSQCQRELEELKAKEGQCLRCGTFGVRGKECSNCFYWPQYFQRNLALVPYTDKWRKTIHSLKFKSQGWLAPPLAELMVVPIADLNPDLVIPVPLHPERQRERGFNQAALLGEQLAKLIGVEYNTNLLYRIIKTPYQSSLDHRQRFSNVRKAFKVEDPKKILKGKNILLVDDLFTSGATLVECSKTLYQGGAKSITSITLGAGIN